MYHTLYATGDGLMYDHPDLAAAGGSGNSIAPLDDEHMIPLPEGASLVLVPDAAPVGLRRGSECILARTPDGKRALPVAACLPQGFTRTCLPAYRRGSAKPLPILGYTAVAWQGGQVYAAALATDDPGRWNPRHYDTADLHSLVKERVSMAPGSRVLAGLAACALEYRCFTAQNIFYRRWEGGLPTTPACNARCLGCLSLQGDGGPPSPQARVSRAPALDDVARVGAEHLSGAKDAIISFGQGCEGEPLLAAPLLAEAVRAMRRQTTRGTINLNSNAGDTGALARLADAGLDSLRASLISANRAVYDAYHRPAYNLDDVRGSLKLAVRAGIYTSLNLLVFPGLTDCPGEIAALLGLIEETGLQMVQLRNLNIDPAVMAPLLGRERPVGINRLVDRLKEVPGLTVGNFTHTRPAQI